MRSKEIINRLFCVLLVIVIVALCVPVNSNADESDDEYIYTSDDGNLTVIMKDGEITITAKSHAASTNVRWRTIGLNITKNPITTEYTYKNEKCRGPVSEGGKKYYLPYDGYVVSNKSVGGTNTKVVHFSSDDLSKLLGVDFDNVKANTIIYMHAVFQTYDYDTDVIRKPMLQDCESIMSAETWSSDTLSDFYKYYNMPLKFKPAVKKCPNSIMYYSTSKNGSKLKDTKSLLDEYEGNNVYWKGEDTTIPLTNNGTTSYYDLVRYEVYTKDSDTLIETVTLNDVDDQDPTFLATNGTEVKKGGMNIYLIYKIRTKPTPTPTPTPKVTPVPTKAVPTVTPTPIVVPEAKTVSDEMQEMNATGAIRADDRGAEKFTVNEGVPTTESLFTNVQSDQWLMGYTFTKKVGVETYAVRATKNYTLTWTVKVPGENNIYKTEQKSETVPVTQTVTIQRAYGYWEIGNFDLYYIDNAVITNYALPGGSTTMTPDSSQYSPMNAVTSHRADKASHLIIPSQITGGVTLAAETVPGGSSRPSIPSKDFTKEADSLIPELTVKNDTVTFNGVVIMDPTPTLKEGPNLQEYYLSFWKQRGTEQCNNNVLYKPGQIIQDIKKNGTYNSAGVITYRRANSINTKYNDTIKGSIANLSQVVIHTPVLCNPIVNADNDKYVQLLNPTTATQLVLDPDSSLNDFTLQISNYGYHSNKMGYYTRDFSKCLREPAVSYLGSENGLLLNEVKFPFDVFMKQSSGDVFIKKGIWTVIGINTVTFYLPMWVVEGTYTVECRSIAVNANLSKLEQISEHVVNSELFNYVATNTFEMEVSGRLYGLSIYDLTDYPLWKESFRVKNSLDLKINSPEKYPDGTGKTTYSKNYSYNYTVGTKDQYGNDTGRNVKYTFPLVNGSHPFYKNIGVLKTGYVVRFTLDTIGTMYPDGSHIRIKPSFYYVDANGKNRTAVDLYYEESINGENYKLVKMGNSLDQVNLKYMETGSPYTGIPTWEMKQTASLQGMKYSTYLSQRDAIFSFKDIRIPKTFRTFINNTYLNKQKIGSQYSKITDSGITESSILKQMQSWYGCYYLPGILHAAPLGYNVYDYAEKKGIRYTEAFWKKDGYIIVNFDIVTVDSKGKERLSYVNATNYLNNGNNSMYTMEGAPLSKTDNKGVTFNFKVGDFIIYYVDKSVQDDYSAGGIY